MAKIILNEKKFIEDILYTQKVPDDLSFTKLIHYLANWFYENEIWYDKDYNVIDKPDVIRINKTNGKTYVNNESLNKAVDVLYFDIDDKLQELKNDYVSGEHDDLIKSVCKNVLRYDLRLRDTSEIVLLEDELENIKSCDTDKQKKLLFVCYIYARYRDRNGKIDDKAIKKTLFDLANIGGSKVDKHKITGELIKKGYIRHNLINDNITIWVNFGKGEPILSVDSFDNLGNYILAYLKQGYKQCEVCGKLIRLKSKHDGSTKYCKNCYDKKQLKWSEDNYYKNKTV